MVNISKSGEEGYYPDLQKTAEERLRSLSPNNRHLRAEEPVLTRNSMNSDEWNKIVSDVASWKKEISVQDLRLTEENNNTMEEMDLPPVRQPVSAKCSLDKKVKEPSQAARVPRVSDYAAWDKYDADTELLKMDLEQQREEERMKEVQQQERIQAEDDRLQQVVKEAAKLSKTEREIMAEKEKQRGNEFYQAKEYAEAIKYYTASIAICPSAKAYNNRAACNLKQCKYSRARDDTNSTLALEPNNVKALFRRSIALQHQNQFREALADMDRVVRVEPRNLLAQQISKDLREQILTLPRNIRIMRDEGLDKPKKIEEVNAKDLTQDTMAGNSYEVNEWGLPKVMCNCSGSPRFLQLAPTPTCRRKVPIKSDYDRPSPVVNNARIVELNDEAEPLKTSTKLEIIEVEKSEASEDFFKPKKCLVVDKRTQKNDLASAKLVNGESNSIDGDADSNSPSGELDMDEDFELNCTILEDSSDSVTEPSV